MKTRHFAQLVALSALWGASFLFLRIASPVMGPLVLAGDLNDWRLRADALLAPSGLREVFRQAHGQHAAGMDDEGIGGDSEGVWSILTYVGLSIPISTVPVRLGCVSR